MKISCDVIRDLLPLYVEDMLNLKRYKILSYILNILK